MMNPEERLIEEMRRVMVEVDDDGSHIGLSHTFHEILTNDCLLGRLADIGVIKMYSEKPIREWFEQSLPSLINQHIFLVPDALPEIRVIIGMTKTPPNNFVVVEETGELLKLI